MLVEKQKQAWIGNSSGNLEFQEATLLVNQSVLIL